MTARELAAPVRRFAPLRPPHGAVPPPTGGFFAKMVSASPSLRVLLPQDPPALETLKSLTNYEKRSYSEYERDKRDFKVPNSSRKE